MQLKDENNVSIESSRLTLAAASTWETLGIAYTNESTESQTFTIEINTDKEVYVDDLTIKIIENKDNEIVQENNYYASGLSLYGTNYVKENTKEHRFTYQGKELQSDFELEWYDFHARGFDAQIFRTPQIDPHAENYYGLSPYSWVANNPIMMIDPDGKDAKTFYAIKSQDGKTIDKVIHVDDGHDEVVVVDNKSGKNLERNNIENGSAGDKEAAYQHYSKKYGTLDMNSDLGVLIRGIFAEFKTASRYTEISDEDRQSAAETVVNQSKKYNLSVGKATNKSLHVTNETTANGIGENKKEDTDNYATFKDPFSYIKKHGNLDSWASSIKGAYAAYNGSTISGGAHHYTTGERKDPKTGNPKRPYYITDNGFTEVTKDVKGLKRITGLWIAK